MISSRPGFSLPGREEITIAPNFISEAVPGPGRSPAQQLCRGVADRVACQTRSEYGRVKEWVVTRRA
jgi:hypothetical protein